MLPRVHRRVCCMILRACGKVKMTAAPDVIVLAWKTTAQHVIHIVIQCKWGVVVVCLQTVPVAKACTKAVLQGDQGRIKEQLQHMWSVLAKLFCAAHLMDWLLWQFILSDMGLENNVISILCLVLWPLSTHECQLAPNCKLFSAQCTLFFVHHWFYFWKLCLVPFIAVIS